MGTIDIITKDGRRLPVRGPDNRPTRAPAGARYRARWRTSAGESRVATFSRKIDAEAHLAKVAVSKSTGEYVDSKAGRLTFNEYADTWLMRKTASVKPGTVATFDSHLRAHLRPAFGKIELRALSRDRIKTWAAGLGAAGVDGKTLAPTTVRAIVFTLAAILREAVDDGRLYANPAERVQAGRKTDRRVDPMHIAHVAAKVTKIADGMPERWRAAVLLMASTGLRLGECLGLTVDRVDFLRRTVSVDRQLANTHGGTGFATTKTPSGVRKIPVSTDIIDLLAAHLVNFPAGDDGLIFTMGATRQSSRVGGPVPRSRWSDHYRRACAAAGVDGRTRTHDLRHVAASSLIAGGLSVAAVQAVLGHRSPAETLDVYTHLWPTDEDRTRAAIEAASSGWIRSSAVGS